MSRFGQFSLLWVDMAERLGLDVVLCEVEWGKGVPLEEYAKHLKADTNHEIKAVFATQNETATGVTSDIEGVRKVMDDAGHPAMLFVDGVSSIASIEFEMEKWGVDLAVSGSQKGFMLPAGLGFLGVSDKALEANQRLANSGMSRCYFSFEDMIKLNDTGYFPYTPATQLLRGLRCSLDMIWTPGWKVSGRATSGWRKACAPRSRRGMAASWWRAGPNGNPTRSRPSMRPRALTPAT